MIYPYVLLISRCLTFGMGLRSSPLHVAMSNVILRVTDRNTSKYHLNHCHMERRSKTHPYNVAWSDLSSYTIEILTGSKIIKNYCYYLRSTWFTRPRPLIMVPHVRKENTFYAQNIYWENSFIFWAHCLANNISDHALIYQADSKQ